MSQQLMCRILNQVFEIEKKSSQSSFDKLERNIDRIKDDFEELGYIIEAPLNVPYDDRRTDVEANITGNGKGRLMITDIIKPIIYFKENNETVLVQKGVIIVE